MNTFNWIDFTLIAKREVACNYPEDQRLEAIISAPEPPAEKVDQIGKPLPESVLVREQMDVANYKRIMAVRCKHAKAIHETNYENYSAKVLNFLDDIGSDKLYVVSIATNSGVYEVLFCPQRGRVVFFKFT